MEEPRRAADPPIGVRLGSSAIPVATTTPLQAFTVPWRIRPDRDSHTVVVKGTFDLVPNGPARLRSETDLPSGDVHLSESPASSLLYPSDFAALKPRCDVVLSGSAHAPKPGATAGVVRFSFGRATNGFDRAIAVFGPRHWQGRLSRTPSDPEQFESVPLVYENAFGGPEVADNPVGRSAQSALLPQLEDPRKLLTSPAERPAPMGFGAIPMSWPGRSAKLGTYGKEWLRNRYPYFPDDFDWSFFQAAPSTQQLEAVVGTEPFTLVGMHREHPRLEGQLPGCRPHCFVQRTGEARSEFAEVELRLDTVVFDLDRLTLNLVWRGVLYTRDARASDVAELYLLLERAAEPAPSLAQAYAQYRALRAPFEPVPEPLAPSLPANDAGPDRPEAMAAHAARIGRQLETAPLPAAPSGGPGVDGTAGVVAAGGLGASWPETSGAGAASSSAARHAKRELARSLLAAQRSLDGCDLSEADLTDLDFAGRSLVGANLAGAKLVGCRLDGANLTAARLSRADLNDASLDDACLDLADLTRARLARTSLRRVSLLQADLSAVDGPHARFEQAHGERPSFARGTWTGAHFADADLPGADFTAAELGQASFARAALRQIRLYQARGSGVCFEQAKLEDARAEGTRLVRSSFARASADGAVFEAAELAGTSFEGASLRRASLCEAACQGASFARADLREARLSLAKLEGTSLRGANLMQASLEAADLSKADLREANLYAAELWRATLHGALLGGAVLSKTKLEAP
jgi:uncharacterized protein YjbI with pentapeptide repeats